MPFRCPRRACKNASSGLRTQHLRKHAHVAFRGGRRGHCAPNSRSPVACAAERMQPAEVARTITSLVTHGTLSTVDEHGTPLGTYVTFVLDDAGCPLIRLRADAQHTKNLQKNRRCTIFAHPSEQPARQLARVTLIGEVEDISEDDLLVASTRHSEIYADAIGVDAPQQDDTFKRLRVENCFYVAGLGEPLAETISGEAYSAAAPDELKDDVARIVHMYNSERLADVMRIAAQQMDVPYEELASAEMLWVDTKGVDVRGQTLRGRSEAVRMSFNREALDDLDVLSLITMAGQQAWEAERSYTPTMPELAASASSGGEA